MNIAKKMPIGYYLKKADNLLTENINRIHSAFGITRIHWQILHSIYNVSEIEKHTLFQTLKPFADTHSLEKSIAALKERDLISGSDQFSLTESGVNLYNECLQKQIAFRNQTVAGITEQEYFQVISTLEKLIENISK